MPNGDFFVPILWVLLVEKGDEKIPKFEYCRIVDVVVILHLEK